MNVTIHRCPVCGTIKGHTDQLVAELKQDPDIKVNVVDGAQGQFSIEADGRRINGKSGDELRDVSELSAEILGAHAPVI